MREFRLMSHTEAAPLGDAEQGFRVLTSQEIYQSALHDLGLTTITQQRSLAEAVKGVTGARINGVDILSVDVLPEHRVSPFTQLLVNSPRTRIVVPEYFYPELERNAESAHLSARIKEEAGARIRFAAEVAEICREARKPVAVADIANKISYVVSFTMLRESLLASPLMALLLGVDLGVVLPVAIAGVAWQGGLVFQADHGTGIFNEQRIPKLDKFVLDFEQARRLFLARGIEQLTQEYSPATEQSDRPQIVVVYPRAHGIRMVDMLVNPHRGLDKARSMIYKLFGPNLDYSVRTYAWKDRLSQLAASGYAWSQLDDEPTPDPRGSQFSQNSEGWILISNRRIQV